MSETLLSVQHLNKRFGDHRVIENLSFRMERGERMALFAPSGAGKTTLIHILSGLEPYDGGGYHFAGEKPATIFQEARLFPFLTVEENILLPFKVQDRPISPAVRESLRRWLEVCQLTGYTRHYPCQISGGMKQKTALIRGWLGNPQMVLMDEPFQSIDELSKRAILEHILRTNPQAAVLFVTHQAEDIPLLAQSVLYFQSSSLNQAAILNVDDFLSIQASLLNSIHSLNQMNRAHTGAAQPIDL